MDKPTFKQLTIQDLSRPYKVDYGQHDGEVAPLVGIGVEFEHGEERFWSGVYLKVGATPEQTACALFLLASELMNGPFGAKGEEARSGNEVNHDQVKHLLPERLR